MTDHRPLPPARPPCREPNGDPLEWSDRYIHDACPSCTHALLVHALGQAWGDRHGVCHLCAAIDAMRADLGLPPTAV